MAAFSFRRRALERVSSPEELDRLVKVALPRTWIALAGLGLLILAAAVWAVVARVPTSVQGEGYVLPEGGIHAGNVAAGGVVLDVLHPAGASVTAGELLGQVQGADGSVEAVRAPYGGRLIEVSTTRGDYIAAGEPLALIDPTNEPLVVYAYLPQGDAKQAHVGDRVNITVSNADPSTYGYMLGRVAAIAPYPATQPRLRSILRDKSVLAKVNQLGPVIETLVVLDRDPSTPSTFAWSIGKGPPYRLSVGTLASASIVTGDKAPIDYVG